MVCAREPASFWRENVLSSFCYGLDVFVVVRYEADDKTDDLMVMVMFADDETYNEEIATFSCDTDDQATALGVT